MSPKSNGPDFDPATFPLPPVEQGEAATVEAPGAEQGETPVVNACQTAPRTKEDRDAIAQIVCAVHGQMKRKP